MASRNSRYYSQTYSLVDNPTDLASQKARHASADYTDYSNFRRVQDHDRDDLQKRPIRQRRPGWSTRKKLLVFGLIVVGLIIIIIAVAAGVVLTRKAPAFNYTPLTVQVNSSAAFEAGGATTAGINNTDGIGAGKDEYTYYSGNASNFPSSDSWISFENMWSANLETLKTSCHAQKMGKNNSPTMIEEMYDAIQNRSEVSLVDHRFIFAIILQESQGCARQKASDNGVKNPGLMQSHDGSSYSPKHSNISILAMVQDGTQGTASGDGLVQNLDYYTTLYGAARGYNSGYIPTSGNLSEAAGATACYVSDVANRLTGWVYATNKCTGS